MSGSATPNMPSPLPFADKVTVIATDAPFGWLAAGWRDFRAAGLVGMAYGLIFVASGVLLTFGLERAGLVYLIAPLIAGFMLVAPALTVGFYAISQDLAAGTRPSLRRAVLAWRRNPGALIGLGLMQVLFLIVWMRFAVLIFALCFPSTSLDAQALLNAALFTRDGWTFLAVGSVVGAAMATIAFAFGAFSLPLLLDRRMGLLEAVVTSAVAVVINARAMAVWAGLIVLFTAAGLALGYVGLVVTLPLVGHATWHAYRAVLRG